MRVWMENRLGCVRDEEGIVYVVCRNKPSGRK